MLLQTKNIFLQNMQYLNELFIGDRQTPNKVFLERDSLYLFVNLNYLNRFVL